MRKRQIILAIAVCLALPAWAPADQPSRSDPADEDLHELIEQLRQSSRQLWRASIAAPPAPEEPSALLERVGRVGDLRLVPEDARMRLDQMRAEEDEPADEPPTRPVRRPVPSPRRDEPVCPEVLAKLQATAPSDPAQAARLADTLFTDGHIEAAYVVYEAALQRETSERRAAWLVFQMANCKRDSDPDEAMRLYGQLISEYPSSRWVEPAKVQERILQWKDGSSPETALHEARRTTETALD